MKQHMTLTTLLESLHNEIRQKLEISREALKHPVTKGDASEKIWLDMLNNYLPKRYHAEKAFVVDSNGDFSDQIDVVIYDRQYSPFIFKFEGATFVPAESVYAVFETKQSINADYICYAQEKIQSVRKLYKTSLPIPHAGGTFPAKDPIKVIGGILTFESDWSPAFGVPIEQALQKSDCSVDLGCVAAHGYFVYNKAETKYEYFNGGKPATAFLFKLISELQFSGTVPMIDVLAYSKWLSIPQKEEAVL
jgi:hypothetical protein